MAVTHHVPTQAPYTQKRAAPQAVQEQVVDAARLQWPLLFSRLFEVTTFSGNGIRQCEECGQGLPHPGPAQASHLLLWPGPRLPKTQLILAVNWRGLYFLDQRERMLLEVSFPEVMSLITNRWVPPWEMPRSLFHHKLKPLGLQER